jgi:hypothetical protein
MCPPTRPIIFLQGAAAPGTPALRAGGAWQI